ncbi:MAG: FliA/WhiG family RNA polymerase sigma factor [Desulfobulbaceae bacterium]|nr:FliA/WhiG family RNA polymerase sigma factor [Desulfobulbaceae bacterium]
MNKQQTSKFKDYTQAFFGQDGQLDPETRTDLILTYTPLIKYIAARLATRLPSHVALDDLISCGTIGLIDAIEKFNPEKKVQFKTYAEFRIKGAMLDELRSLDWVPRSVRRKVTNLEKTYSELEKKLGRPATDEETAEALELTLDNFYKLLDETKTVSFMDIDMLRHKNPVPDDRGTIAETFAADGTDPFAALNIAEIRNVVADAITELPEKEKLTVSLYYFDELTMKEIGEVLGYTESRISQMHSKAMLRLRSKLKNKLNS